MSIFSCASVCIGVTHRCVPSLFDMKNRKLPKCFTKIAHQPSHDIDHQCFYILAYMENKAYNNKINIVTSINIRHLLNGRKQKSCVLASVLYNGSKPHRTAVKPALSVFCESGSYTHVCVCV